MANEVRLCRAEEGQRPAAHPVALGHGDGHAPEGTAEVYRLDMNLEHPVRIGAPGKHGVDRLELLARVSRGRGHDRLRQELPSEDDPAEAGRDIAGPETAVAQRVQFERARQVGAERAVHRPVAIAAAAGHELATTCSRYSASFFLASSLRAGRCAVGQSPGAAS